MASIYQRLERLERPPAEELKLDHLGVTVEQLFADEIYRWVGAVS